MMFDLTYWTAISGYFTLLTYAEELHCTKVCCADVAYHRRRYNAGTMKARSWKPTRRHVSRSFQHRTLLVCRQTTTLSGLNWHRQQRAAFVSIYCTASHCHSHCHSRLRITLLTSTRCTLLYYSLLIGQLFHALLLTNQPCICNRIFNKLCLCFYVPYQAYLMLKASSIREYQINCERNLHCHLHSHFFASTGCVNKKTIP